MKFSAGEVVHILLDKQRHLGLVCEEQPLRVRESKVFSVDTNKLSHPDDLKADDLGSWKNDGQHSRWVKVKQMGGCVTKLEFCSENPQTTPMPTVYIDTTLCTIPTASSRGRLHIFQV